MNNLKRVLSLALASVMVIGMMVIGTSAAKFSDQDKIENTTAVNTAVALSIIKGYTDGTYRPEDPVRRDEMAKMIYVALNAGKENANLTTKTTPTFYDIDGNWAEGYIEWCVSNKIIAGKGEDENGKVFDPAGKVTGSEASKMLLVAIGYDQDRAELVGIDWEVHTNNLAMNRGFYDVLDADGTFNPTEPLTRDQAAQLIYDAITAEMVTYDKDLEEYVDRATALGTSSVTILNSKYGVAAPITTYLATAKYNANTGKYTYTFDDGTAGFGSTETAHANFVTADDYTALIGHKVEVLQQSASKVYGLVDAATVIGTVSQSAYAAGDYTNDAGVDTISYNTTTALTNLGTDHHDFDNVTLIDQDDDGDVDLVLIAPVAVENVTFVGSTTITTSGGTYTKSATTAYDDIAGGDVVLVTKAANTVDNKNVITKAETKEGTITAGQSGKIYVDGTWYTKRSSISTDDANVGDETTLTLVNGLVYANAKKASAAATAGLDKVLYVTISDGSKNSTAGNRSSQNDLETAYLGDAANVVFSDGSSQEVRALQVAYEHMSSLSTINDTNTAAIYTAANKVGVKPDVGLYTYTVNDNGVYELTAVKGADTTYQVTSGTASSGKSFYLPYAANLPGGTAYVDKSSAGVTEDASTSLFLTTNDKFDGKLVDDDAVIFIKDSTSKINVITGKALKDKVDFGTNAVYVHKTDASSNLDTVELAFVETGKTYASLTAAASTTTGYGYITTAGVAEKSGDDIVVKFTAWTTKGSEELTATSKKANPDSTSITAVAVGDEATYFAAGTYIKFEYASDGTVNSVQNLLGNSANAIANGVDAAVTGWDGTKNIVINSTPAVLKDDDKTVIIYVDSAKKAGVEGGAIALATDLNGNKTDYVKNVVAQVTTGAVDYLFVDVNNNLAGASYEVKAITDADAVNGVTYGLGVNSLSANDKVAAGTALNVTVTPNAKGDAAVAKRIVTVTMTLADGTTQTATFEFAEATDAAAAAQTKNAAFTMPTQAVTSIVVTTALPSA